MRRGTFWMRIICLMWLSILAAFSQAPTTDPGEGKLVPSTRTDKPINTHIWIGEGPKSNVPGVPPMGETTISVERSTPFFVGKYAGGDWDANSRVENGVIVGGGFWNLNAYMQYVSRNVIRYTFSSTPLDLSRDGLLMAVKPPFLFLTGTKDFVFTDQEVKALSEYLEEGGCLWVDNGSPGSDSPFDRAFHREVLRLVPSKNRAFKWLPMTHPLFSRNWYPIKTLTPGSTGLTAPLKQIEMDGSMAVLYMPNGYAALWSKPWDKTQLDLGYASPNHQLGVNCLIYLLTRWDDKMLFKDQAPPTPR